MAAWWWSWLLMAIGVTGLYVAGRRSRWGWAIGLAAQVLWIAYALASKQYGFLASALAYGAVYARNLWRWTQEWREEHSPSRGAFAPGQAEAFQRGLQRSMDALRRSPGRHALRGVYETSPGASDARPRSVRSDGNVPCAGLGDPRCDATCRVKPRCGVLGMTYGEQR